jgi:integrase
MRRDCFSVADNSETITQGTVVADENPRSRLLRTCNGPSDKLLRTVTVSRGLFPILYCIMSVKQNLAASRQLFDYLVTGGILPSNPAGSVRGPKYVVTRGKTPVLSGEEMRQLLESIDVGELIGLRDRALIGLMGYSFARVNAVAALRVETTFNRAAAHG